MSLVVYVVMGQVWLANKLLLFLLIFYFLFVFLQDLLFIQKQEATQQAARFTLAAAGLILR